MGPFGTPYVPTTSPENRIADHRTGYKAYNLDAVLDGDLDPVVQSAIEMDEAHRLEQVGQEQE